MDPKNENKPTSNRHLSTQIGTIKYNKILIFNFFGDVLPRGIPIYVQNLSIALEKEGALCHAIVCPAPLRHMPRGLINLLFVLYEQLVMPIKGLAYDHVIYPYNSASILGSLMGRSLLVVHDFIPNSIRNKKFAARYIRTTQRVHAWLGRDVAYVSQSSKRIARALGFFSRSRNFLFPNSFFLFMRMLHKESSTPGDHILLCTGWGENKDLYGALSLYQESRLWQKHNLRILGIAGHEQTVNTFCTKHPDMAKHITVLPRLEDASVGNEYRSAAWVWVHSAKEGYGRSIAEAKLCGCRIVASDIAPFREQRDEAVFLYSGLNRFLEACRCCETMTKVQYLFREPQEHEILQKEIRRFMRINLADLSLSKSARE